MTWPTAFLIVGLVAAVVVFLVGLFWVDRKYPDQTETHLGDS